MKKTIIKILHAVIVPYALLLALLYISFGISSEIAGEVIGRIWRSRMGYLHHLPNMESVATLILTLILGIGAIKFIDRYNQGK